MSSQDYLALRTVHLKAPDEWRSDEANLSFVFQKSGIGKYVSGPNTRRLAPGDVLVFNSAFKGALGSADGGDIEFQWFSVCFEHLFPMFLAREISLLEKIADNYKATRHYPASSDISRRLHAILCEVTPDYNLEHRSQLLRVAAVLLNGEFKSAQTQRTGLTPVEPHMIQVFDRLPVSELLDLSVDDLADKFSCSRRHLSRLFHQHFGLSVAALRMEMRLLKAISLLRNPDAKIINVAEQCGFNHLGLFNTCFKRRFGASPGQWRKNATESEPASDTVSSEGTCGLRITGLCPWAGMSGKSSAPAQKLAQFPINSDPKRPHQPSRDAR